MSSIKENNVPTLKVTSTKNVKPPSTETTDEGGINMKEFASSVLADNLVEEMKTIHDAYLQIKDEFLSSNAKCSKMTYIQENFKDLIQ